MNLQYIVFEHTFIVPTIHQLFPFVNLYLILSHAKELPLIFRMDFLLLPMFSKYFYGFNGNSS